MLKLCNYGLGFEKMEGGLSERYPDKASPVKRHFDNLVHLGATSEPINSKVNRMTSETVKVSEAYNVIKNVSLHANLAFVCEVQNAINDH